MFNELTLDVLRQAVAGNAAALRCRIKLQPAGGAGDKVFPPTYAGGVYAVEDRRIDGRVVRCVLLDSVQSQANRMEEALLDAFLPAWRELERLDENNPKCDLPIVAVHVENHGWVTSLTAPHRIHDAILRDSNLGGIRFRDSEIGKAIVKARLHDAAAFYKYCPTVLLFGTWDSTAGEGLNSAKIPRAVVSEIIGVDITPGVRTGSRIDPLGIKAQSATIYSRIDGGWALKDENDGWIGGQDGDIDKNSKGEPEKFGNGKPSDINHGNVMPDLARFGDRRDIQKQHLDLLPDILRGTPVQLRYEIETRDGELRSHSLLRENATTIQAHAVKPGGVTMEYALHTWTLSLTQLRRLRFPLEGKHNNERNNASQTVLAALALYSLALEREKNGYWLRSRCELVPENDVTLELIGGEAGSFALCSAEDIRKKLLDPAIKLAEDDKCALKWKHEVIRMTPTPVLLELVRRSDARIPDMETQETEVTDAGDQS